MLRTQFLLEWVVKDELRGIYGYEQKKNTPIRLNRRKVLQKDLRQKTRAFDGSKPACSSCPELSGGSKQAAYDVTELCADPPSPL